MIVAVICLVAVVVDTYFNTLFVEKTLNEFPREV